MKKIINEEQFKQFLRLQDFDSEFSGRMRWHFEDENSIMRVQLLYDDIEMNTYLFQPAGFPNGYTIVTARMQFNIDDFIRHYNQETPIFRSILFDKVPLFMQSIANAEKKEVNSCYFYGDEECDLVMPFMLNPTPEDGEMILMKKSIYITKYTLKMLLQIHAFVNSTPDTHFSYLKNVISLYSNLNESAFLYYAYNKIPNDFVSVS